MPRATPSPAVAAPEAALTRTAALALPEDDRPVLLAVSGGNDSVALLAAAARVLPRVEVVHVHHGLRAAADADAAHVAGLAREFGLPHHELSAPPTSADPGGGETAARRRRYRALVDLARRRGVTRLLTAHHLDDDLETLLLHALRGHRGPRAACGVPAVRPAAPDGSCLVVRPFVMGPHPPGRAELSAWRQAEGVPCVEDASNADRSVLRNAVRAWLAEADDGRAQRPRLIAWRRRARAALQRDLGLVATLLERHLRPEGLGARLDRAALDPLTDAPDPHAITTELLRLLGAALATPRRVDPRGPLVSAFLDVGRRGSGELVLPADPGPLRLRAGRAGWHLPHDAPAPGSPAGRVLTALGRTSLYG